VRDCFAGQFPAIHRQHSGAAGSFSRSPGLLGF
jgi:hypothetical protein